jgi:hypothetical protein
VPELMPRFTSTTFDDIPRPDYADVTVVPLPPGATTDPAEWARTVFGRASIPVWVKALFVLRQGAVRLLRIPPGAPDVFAVRRVVGEEALLAADDVHLDWRCGVGVDPGAGLVRVTTTVRLHGARGRLYFAPVRLAHPTIVRSMTTRAAHHLTPREGAGRRW